jgi:hypothetical protein
MARKGPGSLAAVAAGTALGPLTFTVSTRANERYWRSAGVDHPVLRAGALYPPIAANLTILLFRQVAPDPVLQTAQRIVCHRRGDADAALTASGTVTERFTKRNREYAIVEAHISLPDGERLWTSVATFCEP